jgi:hypothetical protein
LFAKGSNLQCYVICLLVCSNRLSDRHTCLDCKVIPGECVVPQHKLVVADFRFRVRFQRSKRVQAPRTKWWKLKEEVAKMFKERVLKEGPWHGGGDANSMWMKTSTYIRKVASEEFGVTKEANVKLKRHGGGTRR